PISASSGCAASTIRSTAGAPVTAESPPAGARSQLEHSVRGAEGVGGLDELSAEAEAVRDEEGQRVQHALLHAAARPEVRAEPPDLPQAGALPVLPRVAQLLQQLVELVEHLAARALEGAEHRRVHRAQL